MSFTTWSGEGTKAYASPSCCKAPGKSKPKTERLNVDTAVCRPSYNHSRGEKLSKTGVKTDSTRHCHRQVLQAAHLFESGLEGIKLWCD